MNEKIIKKGEYLFKEGDKITHVYFIQSGAISQCIVRPKKNIDLYQLGTSQVIGEGALFGASSHPFSGFATTETKVFEIPVDVLKQQMDAIPQASLKIVIKSLVEKNKNAMNDVRAAKMEKDSMPCPDDQTAKIFGSIFHTANHKGKKEATKVSIDWSLMKQYAQRVFGESPKRLEQALCILVKLKIANFEMGKSPDNPDGPEELQAVHFLDLQAVENFFEFFQYYYFKGGKTEVLKVDDTCVNLVKAFLGCTEGQEVDRFGVVSLDYTKTVEKFKADFGITLNPDHFSRLEQKGIFANRKTMTSGNVVVQFEVKEFKKSLAIWQILKEIAKWNEKGFVDLNETETTQKKKSGNACPSCGAEYKENAKFCSECGQKITAAA